MTLSSFLPIVKPGKFRSRIKHVIPRCFLVKSVLAMTRKISASPEFVIHILLRGWYVIRQSKEEGKIKEKTCHWAHRYPRPYQHELLKQTHHYLRKLRIGRNTQPEGDVRQEKEGEGGNQQRKLRVWVNKVPSVLQSHTYQTGYPPTYFEHHTPLFALLHVIWRGRGGYKPQRRRGQL